MARQVSAAWSAGGGTEAKPRGAARQSDHVSRTDVGARSQVSRPPLTSYLIERAGNEAAQLYMQISYLVVVNLCHPAGLLSTHVTSLLCSMNGGGGGAVSLVSALPHSLVSFPVAGHSVPRRRTF